MKKVNFKWLMKSIGHTIYENRSNIEFVAGNVMVVAGTGMIMAKAEDAVEVKREMDYQIKQIELRDENDDWETNGERTKACLAMAKDTAIGYTKAYGPGLAVEVGGLVLIGVSKATDTKEIATVSAALASTTMEFMNYRQRVREDLGDEKDQEFLMGKAEKVVTTFKDENGNDVTIEETVGQTMPKHSALFGADCNNPNNDGDPGMALDFLENHERWLNVRLQKEGIIWENDIWRDLGFRPDQNPEVKKLFCESEGYGITAVDDEGNTNYISLGFRKDTKAAKDFRDGKTSDFLIILDNMEPCVGKKLYRLMKYHNDWDCELDEPYHKDRV